MRLEKIFSRIIVVPETTSGLSPDIVWFRIQFTYVKKAIFLRYLQKQGEKRRPS